MKFAFRIVGFFKTGSSFPTVTTFMKTLSHPLPSLCFPFSPLPAWALSLICLPLAAGVSWAQNGTLSFRQSPASQRILPGEVGVLHVALEGKYASLRWQQDEVDIPGETGETLYVKNPLFVSSGTSGVNPLYEGSSFTCIATDAAGQSITSEPARLGFTQGYLGPFPVSERTCAGCPPPFVGDWGTVNSSVGRTIHLGSAETFACDFTVSRRPTAPASDRESYAFCTTGSLGGADTSLGGAALQRDGVGLPYWMYGWFDFAALGAPRAPVMVCLMLNGAVVASGECDAIRPVRCAAPPSSFLAERSSAAEEYSKLANSFSWGASQSMTFAGRTVQADRVMFSPLDGARLLLPAVQKRSISSLTVENTSAAPATVLLGSMSGRYGSAGAKMPGGYARTGGWDLKKATKRSAAYDPALSRFVLGAEIASDSILEPDEVFLSSLPSVAGGTPSPLSFSWGVQNNSVPPGASPLYRSVRCGSGVCSGSDASLVVDPPASPAGSSPECVIGMQVEGLASGPGRGLPTGRRMVADLQCVETGSGGPSSCAWSCDYAPLGYASCRYVLRRQGKTIATGSSSSTPLSSARPASIKICVRSSGEDLSAVYIVVPLSSFRLGGEIFDADEIRFLPEKPTVEVRSFFGITSQALGGTGRGKVSFSDLHFSARTMALNDAILSIPFNGPDNDCDGIEPSRAVSSGILLDPRPVTGLPVIPTPLGSAIGAGSIGGITGGVIAGIVVGVPVRQQPIGFIPLGERVSIAVGGSGGGPHVKTRSGLPGRCDFVCDFFDCDSWTLTAAGHNTDGSPPAGPTALTLTAYGDTESPVAGGPPVNGPIGTLRATSADAASGVVFTPDFSTLGSPTHTLVLLRNGTVVFSQGGRTGEACRSTAWPEKWGKLGGATECFTFSSKTTALAIIASATSPPVVCDEVRILAEMTPGSHHTVLSKTAVTCSFTGWSGVDCGDFTRFSHAPPSGSTGPQAAAVLASGGASVSVSPVSSGNVTVPKQTQGATFGEKVPRTDNSPAFSVECPTPGDGISIDMGGATAVRYNLRRSDYGSGPDCGVRSVISTRFAKTNEATAPSRLAKTIIHRDLAARCVLQPDFSEFAAGSIEVLSWPWGTDDCLTGATSTSRGTAPLTGYSLTSPVWPDSFSAACAPGAVFMGDIVIIHFPVPVEMSFAGGAPVTIGAVGFVARPTAVLEGWPIQSCSIVCQETSSFVLDGFDVAMMAPAFDVTATNATSAPNLLEWSSRHVALERCDDGNFFSWGLSQGYDIVEKPGGKICHQARIVPPYSPTNPLPPKEFLRLRGEWKGWDGTVKGGR